MNRQEIDSPEVQAKNVAGSLDCIRAAKALNCRMFMDAGSRVEYGLTDGFMQEDIECHPVNQYGKAKWEFYQKAVPLCEELGLHYVHLRFFSCIWNRRPSLVYHFHSCAGTSSRKQGFFKRMQTSVELMYIDDAVEAVYELYEQLPQSADAGVKKNGLVSTIVNIASKDTRVLKDFVEEIHSIAGGAGELEYGTLSRQKKVPFLLSRIFHVLHCLPVAGRKDLPSVRALKL